MSQTVEAIVQNSKCLYCVNQSAVESSLVDLLDEVNTRMIRVDRTDITADNDEILVNDLIL